MSPLKRHLLTVALIVALLAPPIGLAVADEAGQPATATDAAAPAAETGTGTAESAPDCGCGARSPGQLLETQRDVEEAAAVEPGS
jgi:hypothetical protein